MIRYKCNTDTVIDTISYPLRYTISVQPNTLISIIPIQPYTPHSFGMTLCNVYSLTTSSDIAKGGLTTKSVQNTSFNSQSVTHADVEFRWKICVTHAQL